MSLNWFWLFAKHITFFSLDTFKETCSMTSMVILIKKDLKPKLVHYYGITIDVIEQALAISKIYYIFLRLLNDLSLCEG